MRIKEISNALFKEKGLKLLREYLLFVAGHGKINARIVNAAIDWRCNEKCLICYNLAYLDFEESKGHNCRVLLPIEEWREIFLEYKRKGVETIVLTGGEPTLRPEIIDLACEIFTNNVILITNGRNPLGNWPIPIFASIHGSMSELHDFLCGKEGTLDLVKKHIEYDERVVVSFVANNKNVGDLRAMYELAKKLHVRGIIISGYTSSKRSVKETDDKPDPLSLTIQDRKFLVSELMKLWKEDPKFVFMSPEIIKLFWTRKHQKTCNLRDGWVDSRNSAGELIDQCVMGEGAKCKDCYCIIPMQGYATKMAIIRAIAEFSFNPIIWNMQAISVFNYVPAPQKK